MFFSLFSSQNMRVSTMYLALFNLWVCVCVCMCVLRGVQLPWPHGLWPTRLLCPWDSPGKNTGVGCHFLLQGIFQTKGLNPHLWCLLHCQADSSATWEACKWLKHLQQVNISQKVKCLVSGMPLLDALSMSWETVPHQPSTPFPLCVLLSGNPSSSGWREGYEKSWVYDTDIREREVIGEWSLARLGDRHSWPILRKHGPNLGHVPTH